jgi:hypothetical protein
MKMKINDDELTESGEHYPFKCYFKKLLTFSESVKLSQLNGQGYFEDTVTENGDIEPGPSNHGWVERCNWFRVGYADLAPYRAGGATFIGSFDHDLTYIGKALPPGKQTIYYSFNNLKDEIT